jgi:DNA mismatch repair protein MutS
MELFISKGGKQVALTPMMQQYLQVKEKCKDCILFFRLGDFYEMFFEDAENASKELELVLTGRDCGLEKRAPMCGIPYHAANNYIGRLVSKGYKIAICEQMEDPSEAKGIVRRDIIKIITPGTFNDSSFVDENKNNYIMSIYVDKSTSMCGICFADISTGEFYATGFDYNLNSLLDEVSKFKPRECLLQDDIDNNVIENLSQRINLTYTLREEVYYANNALVNLSKQFSNLDAKELNSAVANAANGVLNYILETQKVELSNISTLDYYDIIDYMAIDINSRRNLELTENLREKSKKGSLLWILDKTNTAMGSRMLRKWVEQPLVNKYLIEQRLDSVEELFSNLSLLEDLKEALKDVYDIERIVGKVASKSVNAKELISLKLSIEKIPVIKAFLADTDSGLLSSMYNKLDELRDLYELLDNAIFDAPPISLKEGNLIKEGYNNEVDKLREAKLHGKEWIATLENNEREITGIKSLKVGYNKVFGYYLEISKANYSSIPEGRYIRKQTLANAERFITQDLKEMEDKILGAEDTLVNLEYSLFVTVRDIVEENIERMKKSARILSELDCLISLASIALENNYIKPVVNKSGYIDIKDGRHPVVEKMIQSGSFVGNNTYLDSKESQILLITGPNMAGKSTYMRQTALIVLMAQIGSFVPAGKADISICDKIFTRIGASDDLSSGRSTFMVEMWEVANILNNATSDSLVLLDEVGRGTSTYDGLSIAWAVIEYISKNKNLKCKTLFATHYHELTKLEGTIEGVINYCVSVKEIGNDIVFLRKIVRGGADQSYGIEVAKLAGLPEELIGRAKEILGNLEGKSGSAIYNEAAISTIEVDLKKDLSVQENCGKVGFKSTKQKNNAASNKTMQLDFSDLQKDALLKEISSIDIMNMTPMDSMNKLFDLIKRAKAF